MFVNRTHPVVAATLGALSLGIAGCDDPAQDTDLRPEGPPDVLAVLVATDAVSGLYETATYCRPNDEKRPGLVGLPDITTQQICPESRSEGVSEVSDAYPDGWYIRIMFDELLDPEIEQLIEILDENDQGTDQYTGSIAAANPVTLRCQSVAGAMVTVDYDGYYSPAGNRITWPLGPSLVIKPNDPTLIATNAQCEITINDSVVDKDQTPVETSQRGPYRFRIAPISVLAIDPADDPDAESPVPATQLWFDNVYVQFNTEVDASSFCDEGTAMDECEFSFTPDTAGAYHYSLAPFGLTPAEFGFGPNEPLKTETDYTFQFTQGAKIADRCGVETTFGAPSADDHTLIHFTTDKFKLGAGTGVNIATGETATALKKLKITFTNVLDGAEAPGPLAATAIDPAAWTMTPMPFASDATTALTTTQAQLSAPDFSGQFFVQGHYQLNTMYTFTLKAGSVVTDWHGATYTQAADLTVSWKTQPALTASFTADNTVFTKALATSLTGVTITFNNAIPTTPSGSVRTTDQLTADTEWTVTGPGGTAVTGWTIDTSSGSHCTTSGTTCAIRIRKNVPAGDYKFTLKAGATVQDVFGVTYTQATDKVVNFTVKDPAPPAPDCL